MMELQQLEAQRQVEAAVRHLADADERLAFATEALSTRMGEAMPANEFLSRQDIVQSIQRAILERRQRLADAQRAWHDVSDRRSQLAIQVESLKNLRLLQWTEHRKAVQAKTQRQLDELAVRRWNLPSTGPQEVNPHA